MSLLKALRCEAVAKPPVWLMRQAGRYLPEYQKLRQSHTLETLFHEPYLAAEVTCMPLERFRLDAAIVFSDLLVIVEAWGKRAFYPKTGGVFLDSKVEDTKEIYRVDVSLVQQRLGYVFETIGLVKPKLNVPLLGFCGAPFTLLCYLLEGKGQSFSSVTHWMTYREKEFLLLLDIVCDVCIDYALLQYQAGVDAVQIFDSWTHFLSEKQFSLYALPYWEKMQRAFDKVNMPAIFFSKVASCYPKLISSIAPTAISFDEGVELGVLRDLVPEGIAVQGNFCQKMLAFASCDVVYAKAQKMARSVIGKKGVIFNLGHGVLPNTPIENVHAFLEGITI